MMSKNTASAAKFRGPGGDDAEPRRVRVTTLPGADAWTFVLLWVGSVGVRSGGAGVAPRAPRHRPHDRRDQHDEEAPTPPHRTTSAVAARWEESTILDTS
jgi:hypothetical protein